MLVRPHRPGSPTVSAVVRWLLTYRRGDGQLQAVRREVYQAQQGTCERLLLGLALAMLVLQPRHQRHSGKLSSRYWCHLKPALGGSLVPALLALLLEL